MGVPSGKGEDDDLSDPPWMVVADEAVGEDGAAPRFFTPSERELTGGEASCERSPQGGFFSSLA